MVLERTMLFLILLLLVPDWYIGRNYINPNPRKWVRYAYWIPTILLLIGMVIIYFTHDFSMASMQRLSNYILVLMIVSMPKAIFTLIMILLWPVRYFTKKKHLTEFIACLAAIYGLGCLIYGAVEGKKHFQVKKVDIELSGLPQAFENYRIIQLSDIHIGSWTDHGKALQTAVDLCNKEKADLIAFTGDLVNNEAKELDEYLPILRQLKSKDGIVSILGNHDYSPYIHWKTRETQHQNIDALISKQRDELGWKLLLNENIILHRGNDSIAVVGVENAGDPPFPDYGDLDKAIGNTNSLFKILLSHDPTHWRRNVLPETDIQLTLAGHTHEMQCTFWGFCPIMFKYPEHNGLYQRGGRFIYVNPGLGYVMFPFRIGAWPEITVITLKRAIK